MNRNEAIKLVREYYPSSGKDLNEALETLIPELKENEDEMIRKAIIRHFQVGTEYTSFSGFSKDKILAWLEKQDKKNEHMKHPDMVANLKEYLANTPKEQIEKDWDELKHWNNIGPTVEEFLYGEQKLTGWTEEDEQMVRFYEAYTNNQVGNWPQNKVLEMKSKFNDWVKKVKYRVQPQWKPSKEQLTALEHVSSEYIGSWQPEMLTLFDDLKTLYDNDKE